MRFFGCCSSKAKGPEIAQKSEAALQKHAEKERALLVRSLKDTNQPEDPARLRSLRVGLLNSGNTCYLSVVVQAVLRVWELTEYLVSGRWEAHANAVSTFGSRGRLLAGYVRLLRELGACGRESMSASEFFKEVGRANETVASSK